MSSVHLYPHAENWFVVGKSPREGAERQLQAESTALGKPQTRSLSAAGPSRPMSIPPSEKAYALDRVSIGEGRHESVIPGRPQRTSVGRQSVGTPNELPELDPFHARARALTFRQNQLSEPELRPTAQSGSSRPISILTRALQRENARQLQEHIRTLRERPLPKSALTAMLTAPKDTSIPT